MFKLLSTAVALTISLTPIAVADCGPTYQQTLVDKLYEIQAPGAVIDPGALHQFVVDEHAKCPDDYQGTAFSVYLTGVALAREPDPAQKMAQINTAFSLLRQASDHYDPQMKPPTYKDPNGVENTMWAWSTARKTLKDTILLQMAALAENGMVEPSLTGGEPAVCPYGKETRLADEDEGLFWRTILRNGSFFGTAGMGNEDERAEYDRRLASYDRAVGYAQNRLGALAKACPENATQLLFDRARVLGSWANYSARQVGNIDRAFEDHRIHSSDSDRMSALQDDLEDERNARARQAKAAYDAFYASKAETGSHLDFELNDEEIYIAVQGWAKAQ
ncbi:MAG: hypothetical protein CMK07_12110 [Ponticaulis sp.]|nr:hypothetical protein [Ponticaulis sp.]